MIGAMPAVAVRHERRRQEKRSKRPSQLYLGGPWLPPPSPSPTPSPGQGYGDDDRFPEYYVCGKVSALQLVVGSLLLGAIVLVVGLVQLTPGAADADHRWVLLGSGGALISAGLALTAVRCCCMRQEHPADDTLTSVDVEETPGTQPGDGIDGLQRRNTHVSALQLVVGSLLLGAIVLVVGLVQLTPGAADADHRWVLLGSGGALISAGLALTAVRCCCMRQEHPADDTLTSVDVEETPGTQPGDGIDGLQRRNTQVSALQLVVGSLLLGAIVLVVGLVQLTPGAADADHRWVLLGSGGALISAGLALTAVRCCCMRQEHPADDTLTSVDVEETPGTQPGDGIDGLQRRNTQIGSPSELAALIPPDSSNPEDVPQVPHLPVLGT